MKYKIIRFILLLKIKIEKKVEILNKQFKNDTQLFPF